MRIKQRIEQSRRFARLKRQYKKYERFLIPGMLVLGVVVDFITFKTSADAQYFAKNFSKLIDKKRN